MKWSILTFALLAGLGCGPSPKVAALKASKGPRVDITVEPLSLASRPIGGQSASGRAQQFAPPAATKSPKGDEAKPKRRKRRPPRSSTGSQKPADRKAPKKFEDLSAAERRRIIEGG
jgi:hypothetical protein